MLDAEVIVVGDAMVDIGVKVSQNIIDIGGTLFTEGYISFGGAGNVAVGLSLLGIKTTMIAKVGNDALGRAYVDDLNKHGVIPQIFIDFNKSTGFVISLIHNHERSFIVYRGANDSLTKEEIKDTFDKINLIPKVTFIQGYGMGTSQREALLHAAKISKEKGSIVVYDPASHTVVRKNREFILSFIKEYVDIMLPNLSEAKALSQKDKLKDIIHFFYSLNKNLITIIKLGAQGVYVISHSVGLKYLPAISTKVVDTTGAGDAFSVGIIYGLVKHLSILNSVRIALWLASEVIKKYGARSYPNKEIALKYIKTINKEYTSNLNKIIF